MKDLFHQSSAVRLAGALVAGALLTAPAAAQGPSQAELQAKYEAKLAHEWIEEGGWETDFDQAKARAKAEGKVLFAYFSRSYAP
ncbi:MAG TPA: hypothetical protein VGC54_10040 [Planctomycetota bacterium]